MKEKTRFCGQCGTLLQLSPHIVSTAGQLVHSYFVEGGWGESFYEYDSAGKGSDI